LWRVAEISYIGPCPTQVIYTECLSPTYFNRVPRSLVWILPYASSNLIVRKTFYTQRITIRLLDYPKSLLAFNKTLLYLLIFISPLTLSSHRSTSILISFIMAPELSLQILLITILLFALVARSLLLWVFGDVWPFYKMNLALYILSFLLSAVLAGLF
jgi:hypothetical protein